MIANPAYKGAAHVFVRHTRYEEHGDQSGTHITKRIRHLDNHSPDKQVVLPPDVVPPLVATELWERANEQRRLAKEGLGPGEVRGYQGNPYN